MNRQYLAGAASPVFLLASFVLATGWTSTRAKNDTTGGRYYSSGGQYYGSSGDYYGSTGGYYDSTGGYYDSTGGYYGSTGGYYGSTGGYYDSTGGYYGSTGGTPMPFEGLIDDKYDADYKVVRAYYEGWAEPDNGAFDTAEPIYGTSGELSPTYVNYQLWFEWTAPEEGGVSFSTRWSISTPDYLGDTGLSVYEKVDTDSLIDSGAYGYYWGWVENEDGYFDETYQYGEFTDETAGYDWNELYSADGYVLYRHYGEYESGWFKEIAYNDDEDWATYEWSSLASATVEKSKKYYVLVQNYGYGVEARLAWHMDGHESEVSKKVYRFYSKNYKGHFYTMDKDERDTLIRTNPNWKYEGEAYSSNPDGGSVLMPLYRFYSKGYKAHFFTIDVAERDELILNNPNWRYEGIAYYVQDAPAEGLLPVYRFWSKGYRHHFFTMDEAEKNTLIATNPNWKFERIAFYAVP